MASKNEITVQRVYDELWNKGNFADTDQIIAMNMVDHTPLPTQAPGVEGFKQLVAMVGIAFPDLHVTVEDLISDEDKVVCRWTARGTNTGALLGLTPSGEHITVEGIDIFRMAHGKVVEHWGKIDAISLMQQLGLVPKLHLAEA